MRVIAGSARGMKLKVPRGGAVRPTADRVREALFSTLAGRLAGAAVLDLFAGSGAIGIEALSRGAESCIFVEKNRTHAAVIEVNLAKTGLAGRARLLRLDVQKALELLTRERFQADLVFMDPPYLSPLIAPVLEQLERYNLLKKGGIATVEHSLRDQQWARRYPLKRQKKYGDTALTFICGEHLAAPPGSLKPATGVKQRYPGKANQVEERRESEQHAE